ncbi:MAG: hypothetical protein HOI70_06260, partial [Opitutae bacterium]|nr:hypothetical protein [Opitutae bacterium]
NNENSSPKQVKKIELSTISTPELLKLANPEEKAVFLGLSKKLGLQENLPDKELKKLTEKLKKEREDIQKKKKEALDKKYKYRDSLRKKILAEFPEVSNPYHPTTVLLLSTNKKEKVLEIVNQDQIWQKLIKEKKNVESFESQRFTIEKKEVKIMRLKKCMENIILAHKLIQQSSLEQITKYNQILELERTCMEQKK